MPSHSYYHARRSQRPAKPARHRGKTLFFVVLLVVLFVAAAVSAFFVTSFFVGRGRSAVTTPQSVPLAYRTESHAKILHVTSPPKTTSAILREYFAQVVAFAHESGANTLLFEAKSGLPVLWQDKHFPLDERFATQGLFSHQSDPLALLCDALQGQNIELWLQIDPYSLDNAPPNAEGAAAELARQATGTYFDPADASYRTLLVESLSSLPSQYPVAGIVLTTAAGEAASATAEAQSAYAAGLQAFLQELQAAAPAGRSLDVTLALPEEGGLLSVSAASALQQAGLAAHVMPSLSLEANLSTTLDAYPGLIVAPASAADTGPLLFTAAQHPHFAGGVLGHYSAEQSPAALAVLASSMDPAEGQLPTGFTFPSQLGIEYPAQDAVVTSEELFIMGTSNPTQPLFMNGQEVPRTDAGVFGVAVPLEIGSNAFLFTQESETLELNVIRARSGATATSTATSTGSGGGTASAKPQTTEPPAKIGQAVQVVNPIANATLDDGTIHETLRRGAVFIVEDTIATTSGGTYQMPSGDYVSASSCEVLTGSGQSAFTGLSVTEDAQGEWLNFIGEGTPAAYVVYDEDGTLRLRFYDTSFTLPKGFTSQYVSAASITETEDGAVELALQTHGIWGYSLEYQDDTTRLFLKAPPRLSNDATQPLRGVRIMLDAGHGDTDIGSPSVMWSNGPHEKDLNLALAQATAYRLRQLGADVIMTREDDTFLTLQQRLELQTTLKPDIFLSIHHNAMEPNRDLNQTMGTESYYFHPYNVPTSSTFAQNMLDRVSPATGRTPRKVDQYAFYVTRSTVCPSVLFEYGFVMNPAEYVSAASTEGLYAAAYSTADAILATIPQ